MKANQYLAYSLLGLAASVGACTDTLPGVTGTQSLKVELITPADPGSVNNRLPDTARTVSVKVTAIGAQGEVDTSVSRDVAVYAQFLATLTPELGSLPLTTVKLVNGVSAPTTVNLPPVFGATTLWIEDSQGDNATFVSGTTPSLWFRDPFIVDFQKPADESNVGALTVSPLQDKQIRIAGSRNGVNGKLVVTSVFAQGYTVSDVLCSNSTGAPPCTAGDYDHALIFSFSRPKDTNGREVNVGQIISGFTGGVTEFNGLTELSFPQTLVDGTPDVNVGRLPAPVTVEPSWFTTEKFKFERNEAAPITTTDALLCPTDADYDKFKQWKVAIVTTVGQQPSCSNRNTILNVISAGFAFDPVAKVGKKMKVTGVLRPVSIGTFNVWIIFPRDEADIVVLN